MSALFLWKVLGCVAAIIGIAGLTMIIRWFITRENENTGSTECGSDDSYHPITPQYFVEPEYEDELMARTSSGPVDDGFHDV